MAEAQSSIEPRFARAAELHHANRLPEAEAIYRAILRDDPQRGDCYNNLGLIAAERGDAAAADLMLRKAVELDSGNFDAYNNLGNLYANVGQRAAAAAFYRHALEIAPSYLPAQINLGTTLQAAGDPVGAGAAFRAALSLDPMAAEAHNGLGHLSLMAEELAAATVNFMRTAAVRPDWAPGWNNLGTALRRLGLLEQSELCLRRSLSIQGDFIDGLLNMGNVMTSLGRIEDARHFYERILALQPDHPAAISNLLFALNYSGTIDAATLAARHRELAGRLEASTPHLPGAPPAVGPRGRFRIGYVSPDFRAHSVAYFFEPLLREHDRSRFEIFCYAELSAPDAVSDRLARMADHWVPTFGVTDGDLAARIRADRIDILVDLAGHSAHNRLGAFTLRPAPVQATWLGYPNTTGLTSIDYRLVDAITDPFPEADALASERLVRLEGGFHCYQPPSDAPPVDPPPCLARGYVTFGSYNNIAKLSDATLTAWSALLRRVPDSRLVIKSRFFGEGSSRERFMMRLRAAGLDVARVELREGIPQVADHLASYGEIDISLDSFPYNGTTTLCESLWMGVPAVTLRGDRHLARVGASLLTHIGLPELVAETPEHYVAIAAALAADLPALRGMRADLRPRMASSSLGDAPGFARKIEAAFDAMVGPRADSGKLRVQIVNVWENFGGAALAANRLFRALRDSGAEASMLVHEKATADPDVHASDHAAIDPSRIEARRILIDAEIARFADLPFQNLGVFSLDRSVRGPSLMDGIDQTADIVNLHWVANFIDWELFFAPGKVTAPVVWTLHDMRPMTGGCHYSGACRNYRTGCGHCQFFGATAAGDLSRAMAQRQRRVLENWGGVLHIVTPSRWLAEEAKASHVFADLPISVIPNSIDLARFRPMDKRAAREALGVPAEAPVLLFIAHNLQDSRKGAPILIEALATLTAPPGLVLLTVGDNPPVFPPNVAHCPMGGVTDEDTIGRIYAAADLVVLPTLEDNLPNVILESFAAGRPIVGSIVGGVPDHIVDGETGFLVPPADAPGLAEVLRRALGDLARLAAMGQACRAYAEREFAPEVQAARYEALFQRLLRAPGQPLRPLVTPTVANGSFDEVLSQLGEIVRTHPRHVPGTVTVDGTTLHFADLHRFYRQCMRIFKSGLYAFQSKAATPLIIECGAGIGIASLYFAAHVPGARIEAYEADPALADILAGNLRNWGATAVGAHRVTVCAGAADASGAPSIRLRDLIQGRLVELVSIDLAGLECDLLADCDGALGSVDKMIVRFHKPAKEANRMGDVIDILERNGFRAVPVAPEPDDEAPDQTSPFRAARGDAFVITILAWKP